MWPSSGRCITKNTSIEILIKILEKLMEPMHTDIKYCIFRNLNIYVLVTLLPSRNILTPQSLK
jgi:hypothetical protein